MLPFSLHLKGVEFLDTVWLISMQRQWTSDALKEECRKWFSLLLKAVEIKKGVESILGTFLSSSRAVTVAKDCRPHIETEVWISVFDDHVADIRLMVTAGIFRNTYLRADLKEVMPTV